MAAAAERIRNKWRKIVSLYSPYAPMGQGKTLLDTQYETAEWDYLRSVEELPRFGVVGTYCRKFADGGDILEIGCGDALLYETLDRRRIGRFTGVDISEVAIERTRPLWDERTSFICADAETFTPDQQYDVIVFNEVLEYFNDPWGLVARYEPYLKPGGTFVVSMFAGIDTSRTVHIWRGLDRRYAVMAHARLSTRDTYMWNIKALAPG